MDFFPSREARQDKARLHEQEMQDKYGAIHGPAEAIDFHLWWHDVTIENEAGDYSRKVRELPLPYAGFYPQHFIEQYFSSGSERNLIFNLSREFIGDDIDAEYIECLLIFVEEYGLFNTSAVLVFDAGGPGSMSLYPKPPKGACYEINYNVSSSQVITGSKANRDKAKAIRRWLKYRAKELGTLAQDIASSKEVSIGTSELKQPDNLTLSQLVV